MTKQRSPNFPQYSLPVAIEKIRAVYNSLHTAKADILRVAETLGYTSLSGTSRRAVSALRQYGLLGGSGESLQVTNTAVTILERQPGHPDRNIALQKAASSPALFHEIEEAFGWEMPNIEDLRIFLVNKGFSRTATNEVIDTYRDTLNLVISEGGAYDKQDSEGSRELVPVPTTSTHPTPSSARQALSRPYRYMTAHDVERITQMEAEADQELRFKISPESEARIRFNGEVTQQAIEKLIKLLEISKDTFPSSGQPSQVTTQAIYDSIKEAAQAALTHTNWGVKLHSVFRSQGNSREWTLEFEDDSSLTIEVAPTDTAEEIKSTIMGKLLAGEIK